jgi:hypothetical protein
MGFTNQTCDQSGEWKGRCGHASIVVTKGERFPECSGCRRGIDWRHVDGPGSPRKDSAQKYADSADDGWWPGKPTPAASTFS